MRKDTIPARSGPPLPPGGGVPTSGPVPTPAAPGSAAPPGGAPVPFRAGQPASAADAALKASLQAWRRAEGCAVLWFADIVRRRLFLELGWSSAAQYAREGLGFSAARTAQFLRIASALERLPALRATLQAREIGWTKARVVAAVATAATETRWLDEARRCSRADLDARARLAREQARRVRLAKRAAELAPAAVENRGDDGCPRPHTLFDSRRVSTVSPRAGTPPAASLDAGLPEVPVTVALRFDPLDHARFEALLTVLRRRRPKLPRETLILEALAALLEDATDTNTRVQSSATCQVVISLCPTCATASVTTSAGPRRVSAATLAAATCDARLVAPDGSSRTSLSPKLRRRVLARDWHRCRAPGCGATRFLEVHHLRPRAGGGGELAENLVTLCAACHRLWHERGMLAGRVGRPPDQTLPGDRPAAGRAEEIGSATPAAASPCSGRSASP